MSQRLAAFLVLAVLAALATSGWRMQDAAAQASRIPFQIATGALSGTFFPVGEAMAGLLSHPAGVDRCEAAPLVLGKGSAGPRGLVIRARTSQGAVDNVTEVNEGLAESGLAQADVVAAAVKGARPFKARAVHIRIIASLYDENVHLVVAANSNIRRVADLRGKRVSLGNARANAGITMREVLAAYGVPQSSLRLVQTDSNVAQMRAGKIDAFFAVGGAPLAGLGDLFAKRQARLVPIDGRGRDRLVKTTPSLSPAIIPANLYAGQPAVQTVSTRALWIVRDSVPDQLVFELTRALFHPLNRKALSQSHPAAREITLANAARDLPAALHPGAARFYDGAARKR